MPAPTFVSHADSSAAWHAAATTQTISVTVQTGDQIVVGCVMEGSGSTFSVPTNDGAALTWTQKQLDNATGSVTRLGCWTAIADSNRTIVITTHINNTASFWGCFAEVWRGSDGIGASAIVVGDTTANFSVGVTTTQDHSALTWFSGDWNATAGARTALTTGVGAFTEKIAVNSGGSGVYYVEGGYHADAGTAGAKTVGVSAPTGQKWQGIVVEVKGTAGGTDATVTAVPMAATGDLPAATVAADSTITAVPAAATGDLPAAAVSAGATVAAVPAAGTGDVPAAAASAASTVTATPMAGTGDLPAPAVSADAAVTAVPMAGTGDLVAAVVTATGDATVSAVPMAGTGDLVVAVPSASSSVTATPLAGSGDLVAATVTGGAGSGFLIIRHIDVDAHQAHVTPAANSARVSPTSNAATTTPAANTPTVTPRASNDPSVSARPSNRPVVTSQDRDAIVTANDRNTQ